MTANPTPPDVRPRSPGVFEGLTRLTAQDERLMVAGLQRDLAERHPHVRFRLIHGGNGLVALKTLQAVPPGHGHGGRMLIDLMKVMTDMGLILTLRAGSEVGAAPGLEGPDTAGVIAFYRRHGLLPVYGDGEYGCRMAIAPAGMDPVKVDRALALPIGTWQAVLGREGRRQTPETAPVGSPSAPAGA